MFVNVYLAVVPGADRIFVTTQAPLRERGRDERLFCVRVELPGVEKLDGVITAVATAVDQPEIRLPQTTGPVDSSK